ncbi:MAG: dTDP-4-dehydrorhamnose reductase [Desulfobacteraceae bacterium]|nr:dTDP-4-dehydrorhamnose reductase [Desulfobacteraceae bacterium]
MKILLLGTNGQLGWELRQSCPRDVVIEVCDYPGVDFTRVSSIGQCLKNAIQDVPVDCIINTAAYTAVDRAEQEKEAAYKINHEAVAVLAEFARENGIHLVHISTDFVFNGRQYKPYNPGDIPDPESIYGKSKLAGEKAVKKILGNRALIIRTAWLYSAHGNNFVKTMLRLMAEKNCLNVIDEQVGTPTWAYGLAQAVWVCVQKKNSGTYHWTDAGVASWYDFAVAIQEEALAAGLLSKNIPIQPIPASLYPTPAKRPYYGVLDKRELWEKTGIKPIHWRSQLRTMLKELM